MYPFVFLNDSVVTKRRATIPLNDIGFLRGYAVFDFIKVYQGTPFLLRDHLKRLRASARWLGLKLPKSATEIQDIIAVLLEKNKLQDQDCSVRLVLSGGVMVNGLQFDPTSPTFAVLIERPHHISPEVFERGGRLVTYEHQRLFPEAKTTNYLAGVKAQKKREQKGAIEVLFVDEGRVLEAATSNVFMVKGGRVITPQKGVLPGITRNKVIERARQLGYQVEEKEVSLLELGQADEVFLTATNKEVVPIIRVDGQVIGDGRPGAITRALRAELLAYIESYVKKHS